MPWYMLQNDYWARLVRVYRSFPESMTPRERWTEAYRIMRNG